MDSHIVICYGHGHLDVGYRTCCMTRKVKILQLFHENFIQDFAKSEHQALQSKYKVMTSSRCSSGQWHAHPLNMYRVATMHWVGIRSTVTIWEQHAAFSFNHFARAVTLQRDVSIVDMQISESYTSDWIAKCLSMKARLEICQPLPLLYSSRHNRSSWRGHINPCWSWVVSLWGWGLARTRQHFKRTLSCKPRTCRVEFHLLFVIQLSSENSIVVWCNMSTAAGRRSPSNQPQINKMSVLQSSDSRALTRRRYLLSAAAWSLLRILVCLVAERWAEKMASCIKHDSSHVQKLVVSHVWTELHVQSSANWITSSRLSVDYDLGSREFNRIRRITYTSPCSIGSAGRVFLSTEVHLDLAKVKRALPARFTPSWFCSRRTWSWSLQTVAFRPEIMASSQIGYRCFVRCQAVLLLWRLKQEIQIMSSHNMLISSISWPLGP